MNMDSAKSYKEVCWELGQAVQHRNAMSAMHRNTPHQSTLGWRNEANLEVKRLRQQERHLAKSQ